MSQRRRLSPALDATQNLLDARDLADMLVYIHQFSKQVNFYDFSLEVSTWSIFFEKSPPFILARLARRTGIARDEATEGVVRDFQQYNQLVKSDPTPANFQLLLDFTYRTTLFDVAAWYADTKSVSGFRILLEQEISSREMTDAVRQFIGITNAARNTFCSSPKDFTFLTEEPIWQLDITDLFAQSTPSVFGAKLSEKQQIVAWQKGIERFFDYFSQVLNRLSKAAEGHISESLYPLEVAFKERHEPHLGLLFAFLELFKHLKGQLNEMTARHLDFYFRQILKLKSRKAIPDAVHLVLEVQKQVKQQLLKKGIDFRDGKDAKGQDILFSLDNDIIVNKAQIKSLKTLFVKDFSIRKLNPDAVAIEKTILVSYTEGVFVAPVANSVDGQGMDFKDPMTKNWATLGRDKSKFVSELTDEKLASEAQSNPFARMGFILASSVLFLQEGTRSVTLDLIIKEKLTDTNFAKLLKKKPFKISFSGEKDWVIAKVYTVNFIEKKVRKPTGELKRIDNVLEFIIDLDATIAPIIHFNAENLKENYGTTQPVVKIEIDQTVTTTLSASTVVGDLLKCCAERTINAPEKEASIYHFLKNIKVVDAKISVQVEGIKKNIVVQNDENVQDVNGLIYPFGTRPEVPDFSVVNGYKAGVRSGSNFYIGSKEIFLKKWQQVTVNWNWKDKPTTFTEHYKAYVEGGLVDGNFKFKTAHLSDGSWESQNEELSLFNSTPPGDVQSLIFKKDKFASLSQFKDLNQPINKLNADTRDGFLRLTLRNQDFLHKDYPFVLARQMMAFGQYPKTLNKAVYLKSDGMPLYIDFFKFYESIIELPKKTVLLRSENASVRQFFDDIEGILTEQIEIADSTVPSGKKLVPLPDDQKISKLMPLFFGINQRDEAFITDFTTIITSIEKLSKTQSDNLNIFFPAAVLNKAEVLIPNEPWTPIIKNISLDYAAEAEKEDIAFIHIYPFEATYKQEEITTTPTLLPQFKDEGTLFIGLEQLEPSNNVQILFQLAEATADTEGGRANVKWQYLSKNNQWKDLRTGFEILEDATNGLTASGIIKIAIPEDIGDKDDKNKAITQMPSGQFWLKASSVDNTRAICETLGIFTQAVRATARITEGGDTTRLNLPIPAESVAKLAVEDAKIKQVKQPFESFGGQIEEVGNPFYLRVSERLRHKGRAITPFDYERLLLEAFPSIYKAKCIPHSLALPANDYRVDLQKAAGFVTVAVIPDLTRLKSGDLTEPRVALHVLDEITDYLKARTTPFVRLKIVNPRYEKTDIAFHLKLKKGKDRTYYPRQLETELRRFLAPWSVGDSDKLSFGQPIYYSDILTFIDQREYVDYVKDLIVVLVDNAPLNCGTTPSVNDLAQVISKKEGGVLRPLTPRSVLVAGKITITLLDDTCD